MGKHIKYNVVDKSITYDEYMVVHFKNQYEGLFWPFRPAKPHSRLFSIFCFSFDLNIFPTNITSTTPIYILI